jgi:hypothetical protein
VIGVNRMMERDPGVTTRSLLARSFADGYGSGRESPTGFRLVSGQGVGLWGLLRSVVGRAFEPDTVPIGRPEVGRAFAPDTVPIGPEVGRAFEPDTVSIGPEVGLAFEPDTVPIGPERAVSGRKARPTRVGKAGACPTTGANIGRLFTA